MVIRLVDLMFLDSLANQLMTCLFSSTNLVLSIHSSELILRFHTLTVNHGFKRTAYKQLLEPQSINDMTLFIIFIPLSKE